MRAHRTYRFLGPASAATAVFCALCFLLPTGSGALLPSPLPLTTSPPLTMNWTELYPTTGPSKRAGVNLADDSEDGYVVAFGGLDHQGSFNDTWVYSAGNWTELFPNVSPSQRAYAAMAYDNATQQVLLFGGQGPNSVAPLNDTWAFSQGNWTLLHPTRSPPGLMRAVMTYDEAAGEIVMYGGLVLSGKTTTPSNQTWVYKGGNWKELPRAGVPGINPDAFAYDPLNHGVVLVGTVSPTNFTVLTWIFKQGAWSRLGVSSEPSPGPVFGQQDLVYDARDGFMLLYGSHANTWKLVNGHWSKLHPAVAPRGRTLFGMTFDQGDGYVLLFGGQAALGRGCLGCTFLNDTWEY
jgi:hypothetical protein